MGVGGAAGGGEDARPLDVAVRAQIEWYFSVDNLARDVFLRSRMDAEGFVPLEVLLSFRRVERMLEDGGGGGGGGGLPSPAARAASPWLDAAAADDGAAAAQRVLAALRSSARLELRCAPPPVPAAAAGVRTRFQPERWPLHAEKAAALRLV